MIIRSVTAGAREMADGSAGNPGFVCINVLRLSSTELKETYGVRLAEFGLRTPEEAKASFAEAIDAPVDPGRLARLMAELSVPAPCFIGWQEWRGAHSSAFLTDGAAGQWSLFVEGDGTATLVERNGDRAEVTRREQLGAAAAVQSWLSAAPILSRPAAGVARWIQRIRRAPD